MGTDVEQRDQSAVKPDKTEFAKRNPYLERLVPDAIENAVDAVLPDNLEKLMDRGVEKAYLKYQNFRTDLAEGVGEVAGVLFKVAKYAYEKFHFGDVVFGVYQLALHHSTVNAMDAVAGRRVEDPELIAFLIKATDAANAAYCSEKSELCAAAGITPEDVLLFEPQTNTTRPAYAVWVDDKNKRIIWGFRGTTDLNDMLTDACASCSPYCGGYAHWGMLQAARWFVQHELDKVVGFVKERPGYELLLIGHSLGAGTAAMLAHCVHNDPPAKAAAQGIKVSAIGVATPAVLTEELAEQCSDYITSVVLMHDLVPRFSIHNVFTLKEEMDATDWGDILLHTAKDWAVPDVIENSETYKRLTAKTQQQVRTLAGMAADAYIWGQNWVITGLHYAGLIKPNPAIKEQQQQGEGGASAGEAMTATAATARAAMTDPSVLKEAVEGVADNMAHIAKEDVHRVFAPGKIYFIKRLDKHKGRAKYGNTEHVCVLCQSDDSLPKPDAHDDEVPSAGNAAPVVVAPSDKAGKAESCPATKYELIEAEPKKRFERIVLRETCLLDHLTSGYMQGLKYALEQAKQQQQLKQSLLQQQEEQKQQQQPQEVQQVEKPQGQELQQVQDQDQAKKQGNGKKENGLMRKVMAKLRS